MSDRVIKRATVVRFVRALGYDPARTLRVRVYHDRVEVDTFDGVTGVQCDTIRHPIEAKK